MTKIWDEKKEENVQLRMQGVNSHQERDQAGPDCQMPWYVFVYCTFKRQSRFFLWTSGRWRECVLIAEKRGHKEKRREESSFLQPERLAEGWRLRAAVRREAGRISAGAEKEGEAYREESVDVAACNRLCVTEKSAERVDTTPQDWMCLASEEEKLTTTKKVGFLSFSIIFL